VPEGGESLCDRLVLVLGVIASLPPISISNMAGSPSFDMVRGRVRSRLLVASGSAGSVFDRVTRFFISGSDPDRVEPVSDCSPSSLFSLSRPAKLTMVLEVAPPKDTLLVGPGGRSRSLSPPSLERCVPVAGAFRGALRAPSETEWTSCVSASELLRSTEEGRDSLWNSPLLEPARLDRLSESRFGALGLDAVFEPLCLRTTLMGLFLQVHT